MSQRKRVKFSGLVDKGVIHPKAPVVPPIHATTYSDGGAPPLHSSATNTPVSAIQAVEEWNFPPDQVVDLDLQFVDDSPFQSSNRSYDPESPDELGAALVAAGQREPIQVRRKGQRYELIAGHRRVRAARLRGLPRLRGVIVDMDDTQAELAVLTHNEGREDLTDFERAKAYRHAIDRGHGNQKEVAAMFATSTTNVSRCLSMLRLPQPIVDMLEKKPGLFGIAVTETLNQLLADYPNEQELVVQAVERLNDGAPGTSIKSWFELMYKQRTRAALPASSRPKVVTDPTGRQLYTAKRDGRVITIRISSPDVDGDSTLQTLLDSLKMLAQAPSPDKK